MKNTKNVLMAGVALAIALFASVQVVAINAMETETEIDNCQRRINAIKRSIESMKQHGLDPKHPYNVAGSDYLEWTQRRINEEKEELKEEEANLRRLKIKLQYSIPAFRK